MTTADNSGSGTGTGTGTGTDGTGTDAGAAGAGAGAAGGAAAGAGDEAGGAAGAAAGGAAAAKWWESLTDANLKTSPNITRYDSVDAVAKAMDEATKKLGVPPEQLLRLPTKPDDKAAYDAIYKALGRPEKVEDYGVKFADDATEETKTVGGKILAASHEMGLNKTQVGGLINLLNAETAAAAKADSDASAAEAAATQTTLKSEWGPKFDTYTKEIGKLLQDLGGSDGKPASAAEFKTLIDDLNARGLGNSLPLNRLLARICDLRAEPGALDTSQGRDPADQRAMTPVQAQAGLRAFEADKDKMDAVMKRDHPQHKAMLDERNRLARMADGQAV